MEHIETVHCRTGSLEKSLLNDKYQGLVHCRTGSLETDQIFLALLHCVHCRTGSLEIFIHI